MLPLVFGSTRNVSPPEGGSRVALEALSPTKLVRVDGRVLVAWGFDPDTGDVGASAAAVRLAMEPELSREALESMPHADRRILRKGEYEPEPPHDLDFPWTTTGHPCPENYAKG